MGPFGRSYSSTVGARGNLGVGGMHQATTMQVTDFSSSHEVSRVRWERNGLQDRLAISVVKGQRGTCSDRHGVCGPSSRTSSRNVSTESGWVMLRPFQSWPSSENLGKQSTHVSKLGFATGRTGKHQPLTGSPTKGIDDTNS